MTSPLTVLKNLETALHARVIRLSRKMKRRVWSEVGLAVDVFELSTYPDDVAKEIRAISKEALGDVLYRRVVSLVVLHATAVMMHVDEGFERCLFLQITLLANKTGPVLQVSYKQPGSWSLFESIGLIPGGVTMLDPTCIHTLYNVDRIQKDTVLIQMVLGYTTKKDKQTLIDDVKTRFGDAASAKTLN